MSQNDRTLTSRYEWKYFVPTRLLPSIRAMVRPFVRPDHLARHNADSRYPIVSLYLDGDGLELYRTTVEGHRNRFKLRVRAYDDDPSSPVFLEVKKRSNVVVRKTRARVSREVAEAVLNGRPAALSDVEGASEFALRLDELAARPLVRVRYLREAYESAHGDPVRFTIDTEVEHSMTSTSNLALEAHREWEPTPTEGAIVELKFSEQCPSWATRLIDQLEINRESIPKYVLSLDHAMDQGNLSRPRQSQLRHALSESRRSLRLPNA